MVIAVTLLMVSLVIAFARPRVRLFRDWRKPKVVKQDTMFVFDPNTVTYEELRSMGLHRATAVAIVKLRARGKVFVIPEDFALCYGINDSIYERFKPYIKIDTSFTLKAVKPHRDTVYSRTDRFTPRPFERFSLDTVGYAYLRLIGFSARSAKAFIKYRDIYGPIRDMDELRDCYFVREQMADSLERYVVFPEPDPHEGLVEINSADSAALRTVVGIGAKTVVAIMEYRRLLGGFYSTAQIAELKCVTKENFERISKQIYCDSCVISKIDINFASAFELERHPYMTREAIRKIIDTRKSKGGWSSVGQMIEDNIFKPEQAAALAPYLCFGDKPANFD